MSWKEAAHRAWGLSIACPRRMGKKRKMAITPYCHTHSGGLFCSVRELVTSTLLLLSCIIFLTTREASGLRKSNYYQNLVSELPPLVKFPSHLQISELLHCTRVGTGHGMLLCAWWAPTGITSGLSSHFSWDKSSPCWKGMFPFIGFRNSLVGPD